jgi:hypothetical protein
VNTPDANYYGTYPEKLWEWGSDHDKYLNICKKNSKYSCFLVVVSNIRNGVKSMFDP